MIENIHALYLKYTVQTGLKNSLKWIFENKYSLDREQDSFETRSNPRSMHRQT